MDVSNSRDANRNIMIEEDRYNKYMAERKAQQALEVEALETEHKTHVDNLTKVYKKEFEDADAAYRVDLKRTVEMNAAKLAEVQKEYEQAIKSEKENEAKEFDKVREREKTRIEAYKKNQDSNLEKMHEKYITAQEEMERAQKT